MTSTWLLVAESSRARIFAVEGGRGELREIEALEHPEARWSGRDLATDRPGRSFDSAGEGRHAMEQEVGPKEQEARIFAQVLSSRLEAARTRGELGRLIVAAAPGFLGLLRKTLSVETAKLVTLELDKNLAQLDAAEIRTHLPDRI
jgi:protein required for attachment to host cells